MESNRKVKLDGPFRPKHLAKGLKQLSEEGAVQHLKDEYNVTTLLKQV